MEAKHNLFYKLISGTVVNTYPVVPLIILGRVVIVDGPVSSTDDNDHVDDDEYWCAMATSSVYLRFYEHDRDTFRQCALYHKNDTKLCGRESLGLWSSWLRYIIKTTLNPKLCGCNSLVLCPRLTDRNDSLGRQPTVFSRPTCLESPSALCFTDPDVRIP